MATFREILQKREETGETALSSAYRVIYNEALQTWLPQLGQQASSQTGIPHIQGVERHIDAAVPDTMKERFTSTEMFILLASILVHDIGKLFPVDVQEGPGDDHAKRSCVVLQRKWAFLRFPMRSLAHWCAAVTCAHTWDAPFPGGDCRYSSGEKKECGLRCNSRLSFSELNTSPDAEDGPIRLDWLATLLRIGDEVDNCSSRAIPDWQREVDEELLQPATRKAGPPPGKGWRRAISSVVFDRVGRCVRYRAPGLEIPAGKTAAAPESEAISAAIARTNGVLRSWRRPLIEMGLPYLKALLEVPAPRSALFGASGNHALTTVIEPALTVSVLERVYDAMIRLDNGVIRRELFSWDQLAGEAGIANAKLVELAAKRLLAISQGSEWYQDLQKKFSRLPELTISNDGVHLCDEGKGTKQRLDPSGEKLLLPAAQVIDTGIAELNELLHPEGSKSGGRGGFYYPVVPGSLDVDKSRLFPIIAIEGSSGAGKTTMALQVAWNLVRPDRATEDSWICLYYSLEQDPARLLQCLDGYQGFSQSEEEVWHRKRELRICDLETKSWYRIEEARLQDGQLLLPRLSPRSASGPDAVADTTFETRYSELLDALRWVVERCRSIRSWSKQKGRPRVIYPFFVIDSLAAFANAPLTRQEVYKLFSLFREAHVPLLVALEQQPHWALEVDELPYSVARYLSDIVVRLESGEQDGYFKRTIEVTKSRYCRHTLGKHSFKLKAPRYQTTREFDNRCGVVIYPSIHYTLSTSRKLPEVVANELIISAETLPIGRSAERKDKARTGVENVIDSDTCVVVSGPHGGHKLAIALNILLSRSPKDKAIGRTLIVSLSEERNIELNKVALLETVRAEWQPYLHQIKTSDPEEEDQKLWQRHWGLQRGQARTITVMNFRMGQIFPEEFLFILKKYLDETDKNNPEIRSILFVDTAQLRTRFPALHAEPLFLPALVEIIKSRGLFSVFVDVVPDKGKPAAALLAAADCRILVEQVQETEQTGINLKVHNVRGKNYDLSKRWVSVVSKQGEPPVLKIDPEKSDEETPSV